MHLQDIPVGGQVVERGHPRRGGGGSAVPQISSLSVGDVRRKIPRPILRGAQVRSVVVQNQPRLNLG